MTVQTSPSRLEIDTEVLAAEHEYREAQKTFRLASLRRDQAEIGATARRVSAALDQLARLKQQYSGW